MRASGAAMFALSLSLAPAAHADSERSRRLNPMIETLTRMCETVVEQPAALAAAQRFGMHLIDEGPNMSVTFTPRDRHFASGQAGRQWGTTRLEGMDVTVDASATLTLGSLRAAFGTFKLVRPEHFDSPLDFVAQYLPPRHQRGCSLVVRLRNPIEIPSDTEPVAAISIVRE